MPIPLFKGEKQAHLATQHNNHTPLDPLYPYAPSEYEKIHIVGHRLINGEILPVKIFVEGSFSSMPSYQLQLRERLWQQRAALVGIAGFIFGFWAALLVIPY